MVRVSEDSSSRRFMRPFFWGKKPSKQNLSHGKPLCTTAGMRAVAPGSVTTSIPSSTQRRTSKKPGSEMPGVPASDTNATSLPAAIDSTTRPTVACSLNLWCECIGFSMPRWRIRCDDVRVSSARMKSTSLSTFMARRVISSRLPMGVGTIYSFAIVFVMRVYVQ